MAWLAQTIPQLTGSGIVYALTIADANRTAAFLRSRGIDAAAYTGQTDPDTRLTIEERLSNNDLKVVVATSALAMGYDNPYIEFVIHFQIPGSAISYYQQVGRSGRAVDQAYGVALSGVEDVRIQDYFIETAFPSKPVVDDILNALAEHPGLGVRALLAHVNIRQTRLDAALNLLDVEGAVYKEGSGWYRSAQRWEYPADRFERVTQQRRVEQAAMREYVVTENCLMAELRGLLDDPSQPCGRCANCRGGLLSEASTLPYSTPPRRSWRRRRSSSSRASKHRQRWRGSRCARRSSNVGGPLPDTTRGASANSYAKASMRRTDSTTPWLMPRHASSNAGGQTHPQPGSRQCPIAHQTASVESLGRKLAERLSLDYIDAVVRTADNPPQKTMENSFMQASNVMESFSIRAIGTGPVLLVDDIIDSGWTVTVIGNLLLQKGSGPVFPFSLSYAGTD